MLHVINPNSSAHVTAAIERAAAPFLAAGHAITCVSMADGPAGIETEADMHAAVAPMLAYAEAHASDASGFVIACFGDPGLHLLRERYGRGVYGIAECGVLTALTRADRFGVIAIKSRSIPRHIRYLRQMGLMDRLAGERPLEMSVAESASGEGTLQRMIAIGRELRDQDGAGAIVMGCAGMARHRRPLEDALDVPVVDPTQAAVAMAIGTIMVR